MTNLSLFQQLREAAEQRRDLEAEYARAKAQLTNQQAEYQQFRTMSTSDKLKSEESIAALQVIYHIILQK